MEEDFVSLKLAQLLKQNGFDEPVNARYSKGVLRKNTLGGGYRHNSGEIDKNYISAPTQAQVIKWARIKNNVRFETLVFKDEIVTPFSVTYYYRIINLNVFDFDVINGGDYYNTPEEAAEAGLIHFFTGQK